MSQLHREMEQIRLECDALVNAHFTAEQQVLRQVHNAKMLLKVCLNLSASHPSFTDNGRNDN
jgi:hypothetical protein